MMTFHSAFQPPRVSLVEAAPSWPHWSQQLLTRRGSSTWGIAEILTAFLEGARQRGAPALWGRSWSDALATQVVLNVCHSQRSDDWSELVWALGTTRRLYTEDGLLTPLEVWARHTPLEPHDLQAVGSPTDAHEQQEQRLLYARECVQAWGREALLTHPCSDLSLPFQALYSASIAQPEKSCALLEHLMLKEDEIESFLLIAATNDTHAPALSMVLQQLRSQNTLHTFNLQAALQRSIDERCSAIFWILARHSTPSLSSEAAMDWAQRHAISCSPEEKTWLSREIARAQRQLLIAESACSPTPSLLSSVASLPQRSPIYSESERRSSRL